MPLMSNVSIMEISLANLDDAPGMAKAHVASWQAAYSHILEPGWLAAMSVSDRTMRWQRVLSANESTNVVAKAVTEVLGFVSFGPCRDEGAPQSQAELWALYAAPEAWGRGVGRMLTEHALKQLKAAGYHSTSLWVLTENHRGRSFYEAFGFRVDPGSEKTFELGGRQVKELRYLRADEAYSSFKPTPLRGAA
jgi:ribosomal protein S18 acetylase RimI-like enzyme